MNELHLPKTREFKVGNLPIGGDAPIRVQSMCTTHTTDIDRTVQQIEQLTNIGCEIVRIAVPNMKAARCIKSIKDQIRIPLVADIAFNYQLAMESIKQGVDKIRITPSNIGIPEEVRELVARALDHDIAIRIGVNSGALDKDLIRKYGPIQVSEALVESALREVDFIQTTGFDKIVISVKATTVNETIKAYRQLAQETDFPLHVGLTEAGTRFTGAIRSSIGIGILLSEGIGNTIRVSLSADPVEEVRVGWEILKALELRQRGCTIISCPTCGRTDLDVIHLAEQIESSTSHMQNNFSVAIMGCIVNGLGESLRSDITVVGGKGFAIIYRKGKKVGRVKDEKMIMDAVLNQINILDNGEYSNTLNSS